MFKPNIIKESLDILNEVYFGSKPVEKIQKQLSIARAKYLVKDNIFKIKDMIRM